MFVLKNASSIRNVDFFKMINELPCYKTCNFAVQGGKYSNTTLVRRTHDCTDFLTCGLDVINSVSDNES